MTITNTPGSVPGSVSGSVQRTDDPNIHGVAETKAFFKTTKFIVFIVATVGGAACVLLGQGEPTGTLTVSRLNDNSLTGHQAMDPRGLRADDTLGFRIAGVV